MGSLEMRAKCRRLRAESGVDMIIIDYLQLMRGNSRNQENRNQEISEIARGLKSIARELNVPVIALSQLSRSVERREDKRPMLSDLRECLVGSTRLWCAKTGKLVPIANIRPGDSVLTMNAEQKIIASTVTHLWKKGVKPVFRVTTENGRVITCTNNHPFLTQRGYVALSNLTESDYIASAWQLPNATQWESLREGDEMIRNTRSQTNPDADIAWEKMCVVEPCGEEATYDICVPETGCFLAEGIVVHNSGAIEAEADIVSFIYRPAYYERKQAVNSEDEENKDALRVDGEYEAEEAEIIIAKQRNGPVGTVKLAFIPKFAKFDNLAEFNSNF
jgi:replicative DNA helicase